MTCIDNNCKDNTDMKRNVLFLMFLSVICLVFTACEQKVEKTDPISVIEKLSQEVDKSCDSWDKAAWDDAADRLQNALIGLSQPIDTTQLNLTSALESLLMNAHAHERQAIKMLQVLKPYEDFKKKSDEDLDGEPDESLKLEGSIDGEPISMELGFWGDRVKGCYYYDKNGPNSKLILTGTKKNGVIDLVEKDEKDKTTGHFSGDLADAIFSGTFTNSKGRKLNFFLVNMEEAEDEIPDESFSNDVNNYDTNEDHNPTAESSQTSAAARDAQIDAYETLVNKYIATMNKVINGDMDAYDDYNSLKSQVESFDKKMNSSQWSTAQKIRHNRIAQRYKDRLKELGGI